MFTYDETDTQKIITACDLTNVHFIGEPNVTAANGGLKCEELFPIGSTWINKKYLHDVVNAYSARTGWNSALKNSTDIRCSCFGPPLLTPRNFSQGCLKKNCTWKIVMTSSSYSVKYRPNGTPKKVPTFDDDAYVTISKSSVLAHGGTCNPSPQQQMIQRSRSGDYVKKMSDYSFYTLCNMMQCHGSLKSCIIKATLKEQFPANKNVTKHHVFNVKRRIQSILPLMKNVKSYNDFKSLCNTSNLDLGLDNNPLTDDDISEMARDLWQEFMADDANEDSMVTFTEYMEILREHNSGFRYVLLQDKSGKYTGCLWQTATMRDSFERFGGFISIDAMKRGINKFLWPYVAITMYNEMESICVGCEGIICTEREEAYRALIDFVLDSSPKRARSQIYVLSADGFVSQDIVTNKFNLPNAVFMADQWHLFDSVLPKRFGDYHYRRIEGHLREMCNATSEHVFDVAYSKAMAMLQNAVNRNGKAEDELKSFKEEKATYASYILCKKRGTRGKHGSSLAESNHSSVLVFLNDGEKKINTYCEEPHTLVKDLFQRQKCHINKWNEELYNDSLKMHIEANSFNASTPPALVSANSCLSLLSYGRFKKRVLRLNEYCLEVKSDTHIVIRSRKYANASPRHCYKSSPEDAFFTCHTCEAAVAYEEQCEHSLLSNDMHFIREHFAQRHFRRESVQGSYIHDPAEAILGNSEMEFVVDNAVFDSAMDNIDDASIISTPDHCQASSWENDEIADIGNNGVTIKPLSFKDLQRLFDDILSKYDKCNDDVKYSVGSLAVSMKEMTVTDGKSRGILDVGASVDIMSKMSSIIDRHKSSFLPKSNAFVAVGTNMLKPSATQIRKESKHRLRPNREKRNKGQSMVKGTTARVNHKAQSSCSFCGNQHRITSCKQRKLLQQVATEYLLGANESGLSNLIRRMEHDKPFNSPSEVGNLLSSLGTGKGKHVFIHHVWSAMQQDICRLTDMSFEISFINSRGCTEEERHQITGQGFNEIISNLNSMQARKKFVYYGTQKLPAANISQMLPYGRNYQASFPPFALYPAQLPVHFNNDPFFQDMSQDYSVGHQHQYYPLSQPINYGNNHAHPPMTLLGCDTTKKDVMEGQVNM